VADGVTGFIVETMDEAVTAARQVIDPALIVLNERQATPPRLA
jgi:hypothetical protein